MIIAVDGAHATTGLRVLATSGIRIPCVANDWFLAYSGHSQSGNFEMRMPGNFQTRRGGRFGARMGGNPIPSRFFLLPRSEARRTKGCTENAFACQFLSVIDPARRHWAFVGRNFGRFDYGPESLKPIGRTVRKPHDYHSRIRLYLSRLREVADFRIRVYLMARFCGAS